MNNKVIWLIKSGLPTKFMFLDCIMVTSRSKTLLYTNTSKPDIDKIKTIWFSLNFLAFMKAIILDSCHNCHCAASFGAVASMATKNQHSLCIFAWDRILTSMRSSTLNQNASNWMGRVCGYRILLQTAKLCLGGSRPRAAFYFKWPHLGSGGDVLLQTAAFCFGWPYLAMNSRVLLQMAAFCFRWLHFTLDRCILLRKVAFCVTRPLLPLDHH